MWTFFRDKLKFFLSCTRAHKLVMRLRIIYNWTLIAQHETHGSTVKKVYISIAMKIDPQN